MRLRTRALAVLAAAVGVATVVPATAAHAATTDLTFGGTITTTMSVNDGTNIGSIPAGTKYTGSVSYDLGQTPAPAAFNGGSHTVYTFTNLAFTIGTSTANSGPGRIDVYDNLSGGAGYPAGDSVYVNFGGVAPSGLLAGAEFNWMGLALLDPTGAAVSGGALPAPLSSAGFSTTFSEFNFGTKGTRWGAGNTSTIQSLTSVGGGGSTPAPVSFTPTLPGGTVGTAYDATFGAASGGTGTFTYAAAGLPDGLALSGRTVSGTPTTAGVYPVTLTATDSAGTTVSVTAEITVADAVVACSGSNGVVTSYVARNPGFIVVNGGAALLDHLWTTNLNAATTTFRGGLTNWYQTGLVVDWTGTSSTDGCVLDTLTVSPSVKLDTTSLPAATTDSAYQATVSASWGVAPYRFTATGLPAGLTFDGTTISGTPTTAGVFPVTISVADAVGGTASATVDLTVTRGASYTVRDESKGKITAVDPDHRYLMVGSKKLVWNDATLIVVNTPAGERHVIDDFVKVGMKVQWKGLRDPATNTVMTKAIEVN